MGKKDPLVLAGAVATASLLLTACGGAIASPASRQSTLPRTGQKTLVVANWEDYGSDLPWVEKKFQQETGAKVVNVYFNSEAQALQILRDGGIGKIDVTLPNLAYVDPAASQGLLQPLDPSRLTNLNDIIPQLRNSSADFYHGKRYGIPWTWGSTSLAYNPKDFTHPIDSWASLWSKQAAGKVGFFDDPTTAVMVAALYLHQNPLNPNLAKVRQALMRLKNNVKIYWSSQSDWTKAYQTGEVTIGDLWSGLAGSMAAEGKAIRYVIPKEGGVGWADNWAIVKNAPNLSLAYKWLNFMTGSWFQLHYSEDATAEPPAPTNLVANANLPALVRERIQAYPAELGHMAMQTAIPPSRLNAWTQLWDQVKAS